MTSADRCSNAIRYAKRVDRTRSAPARGLLEPTERAPPRFCDPSAPNHTFSSRARDGNPSSPPNRSADPPDLDPPRGRPLSSQAHGDAIIRAFSTKKYPRLIVVKDALIVSVKVDDRGFVVHKWTKKIVDLKQVYLVVKDNRRVYQLALEFNQRPGEKKPFTDVLQFNPTTSRDFTQTISRLRKELLGNRGGRGGDANAATREEDRRGAPLNDSRRSFDRGRDDDDQTTRAYHASKPDPPRQSAFGDAIANANARYRPNAVPVPHRASLVPNDPFARDAADPFSAPAPFPELSPSHASCAVP